MDPLRFLLTLFFGDESGLTVLFECLLILGLIKLFPKCGTRWWYALIPGYLSLIHI